MRRCAVDENALPAGGEMSPLVSTVSDGRDPLFCPRPRRITQLSSCEPVRPLPRHLGPQVGLCDPKPRLGDDVLDIILAKGVASSPPYFSGSPPSRVANPVVYDARFGEEGVAQPGPLLMPAASAAGAAPSSAGGGRKGWVRKSFGPNPAAVRIEGFDCLDRDSRRGSCGITAVA